MVEGKTDPLVLGVFGFRLMMSRAKARALVAVPTDLLPSGAVILEEEPHPTLQRAAVPCPCVSQTIKHLSDCACPLGNILPNSTVGNLLSIYHGYLGTG